MFGIILAATIDLVATWTASVSEDVAKYRLYMSNVSGTYSAPLVEVGKVTSVNITVPEERNKFFVLTAVDEAGNESDRSNEVMFADKKKPLPVTGLSVNASK